MIATPATRTPEAAVSNPIAALLRDSSQYLLGLIGSMALGFISFPIFTRALPVAEYGAIDLALKVLLVLTAFAKLGITNSALRFYDARKFADDAESARQYYSTMFLGSLGPALVFAGGFALVVKLWAGANATAGLAGILMLSALLVAPRSVQAMFWSFLRVEQRTKAYNIITVSLKAVTILAICALIRWKAASAGVYFWATIAVETVFTLGLIASLVRRGLVAISAFDSALFRAALVFGIPLVVNEIAFVILDAADRTLVQHYLGAVDLGVYAVAYGLAAMVQSLLITPLNLAVVPMYLQLWNAGEREKTVHFLGTGLDLLMLGGTGLFVVVSATAHDLVLLSASSKYAAAGELIPMIFGGLLIFTAYVFVNAGLMIEKKTASLAGVMAAAAAVNVALNCGLLPRMGLRGAALATLLSYAFCIVAMAHVSFRALPVRFEWTRAAVYAIAAAIAWAVSGLVRPEVVVLSAIAKAAVSGGVYALAVYAMDARVRRWTGQLLGRVPGITHG